MDTISHELKQINQENHKLFKQLDIMKKKKIRMQLVRQENGITQDDLKLRSTMIESEYKRLKIEVQSLQKEIEQKIRERKLLNNDVVAAEAHERLIKS